MSAPSSAESRRLGYDEFLCLVRRFIRDNLPGEEGDTLTLTFTSGRTPLQVPVGSDGAASSNWHSPDFRSVRWHYQGDPATHEYTFTSAQAAVIKLLWAAHEHGQGVGQAELLEAAESDATRLRDVFKSGREGVHTAWGELVRSNGAKGVYQLADAALDD